MKPRTFKASVKLSNGVRQNVTMQADSVFNAKAMLETQYGKGNVGPVQEVFDHSFGEHK